MSHYSVMHWSAINCEKSEVLNVSGHVAPCEKHPGNLVEGFSQTQVCTLAVKDNLLVAGGFQGELICKELDFFGEISGMSFSPDTEALFIGVWDRTYGGLLHYWRCRNYLAKM